MKAGFATLLRGFLVGLFLIPASLALAAPSAIAATISVTSTADVVDGAPPCTLREAIQSSNTDGGVGGCTSGSGSDRIELPSGTYTLSIAAPEEDAAASGDLDLTEAAEIVGAGRDATIIDGNGGTLGERVFDVLAGPVALSDLEVTDGMSSTGGGIRASASFELRRVDLAANISSFLGGAVFAAGVSGEISDSAFIGNRAVGAAIPSGGAIHSSSSDLLIRDSTFTGNDAEETDGGGGTGGAISNFNSSTAEIRDSVISGNQTDAEGSGAGVFNTNSSTLIVRRATISGNAAEAGGGLFNTNSAKATLVNSTISGNDANDSGGGIFAGGDSVSLLTSTVTNNRADLDADGTGDGGGLRAIATVDLNSSVVAGNNDVGPGVVEHECSGVLGTVSYSLVGDSSCAVGAPTSNLDSATDPMLESLAANGGLGQTHALAEGSPLIDAGSPEPLGSDPGCPTTDQRGVARFRCDIGAFEVEDTAVEGSATAKKKQKQKGKKIIVKAKVKAGEELEAKGKGKVKVKKKSYKLKPLTKSVSSGDSKNLKLKPKKSRDRKKIAKAMKKGKKATAKLEVKLTDEVGNKKTTKLRVKLKP